MAGSDKRTFGNLILWQCEFAPPIPVRLDSAFQWEVGLDAGVARFTVTADLFNQLLIDRNDPTAGVFLDGSLLFFDEPVAPSEWPDQIVNGKLKPKITIDGCRIMDVQAGATGVPLNDAFELSNLRCISYQVCISDFRWKLGKSRGGSLINRQINVQPIVNNIDANKNPALFTAEIFRLILAAIPVRVSIVADFSAVPPLRDLKFENTLAVDALASLLKTTGCVFVPKFSGHATIERIGVGEKPKIPDDNYSVSMPLPAIDIRPPSIVIEGGQTIESMTVDGIGNDGWEFVLPDETGAWVSQDQFCLRHGLSALTWVRSDSKLVKTESLHLQWQYLYRCIRLNPTKFGDRVILRQYLSKSDGLKDIEVLARRAVEIEPGIYQDLGTKVQCTVADLMNDGRVIRIKERLLTLGLFNIINSGGKPVAVPRSTNVPQLFYQELLPTYLSVTFASAVPGNRFRVGFIRQNGKLLTVTDDGEIDRLQDEGAVTISMDELVLQIRNHEEQNRADLMKSALAVAQNQIGDPKPGSQEIWAAGFPPVELNGNVPKIEISQSPPKTLCRVGGVFSASVGVNSNAALNKPGGSSISIERGVAQGKPGYTQPVSRLGSPTEDETREQIAAAIVGSGTPVSEGQPDGRTREGGGIYSGNAVRLPQGFAALDGGGLGQAFANLDQMQQVVVCNTLEIYTGTNMIPPGTFVVGKLGRPTNDGRPTIWVNWDPSCYRSFRLTSRRIDDVHDKNYGKNITVFQGSHWPQPIVDSQWDDLIPFSPCSPTS
jgi:hypothetical protein